MIKCEKCGKEITETNFWEHSHDDYESIDYDKHYKQTAHNT